LPYLSLPLVVCRWAHVLFWPLHCLFFFDLRILMTPLVSSNSSFNAVKLTVKCYKMVATVLYLFAYSGVQHILCCVFVLFFFVYVASFSGLSFFDCPFGILYRLIFDHCVVCSFSIYGFWWPLWYLQTLLSML
jgi:hypothetical protein